MKKMLILYIVAFSSTLFAGKADVMEVKVHCPIPQNCTFNVTVQHADTGWEHYANQWDILTTDGKLLASRVLYHPHVNEQPFTRSLSGVQIPSDINRVTVRARDLKHGWGGRQMTLQLPAH